MWTARSRLGLCGPGAFCVSALLAESLVLGRGAHPNPKALQTPAKTLLPGEVPAPWALGARARTIWGRSTEPPRRSEASLRVGGRALHRPRRAAGL